MKGTHPFVLDGSVALAWFFTDEADPYADAVAIGLPNGEAFVPALWHLEIANAVVVGERRKRGTVAQATYWFSRLVQLPIRVDDLTETRAWSDTISQARNHDLTAYDAAYLELAIRRGLPLATLDDKLKTAARTVGVALYKP